MCVRDGKRERERVGEKEEERERERERRRRRRRRRRSLVSWRFKLSQPQRIISGLRKTVIKRYVVEGTNTAEIKTRRTE